MPNYATREAPLVLQPTADDHTATVIVIHGFGDSGLGWADSVEFIRQRNGRLGEVKFVLPHAPNIPVTVTGGLPARSWFDIKSMGSAGDSLSSRTGEDVPSILQARTYIHQLVQDEVSAGIPPDRIVLMGFSQGGAMSLFSGLTAPVKLGGIIALSCWLILHDSFQDYVPDGSDSKTVPIFMAQGDQDTLVPFKLASESADLLKSLGGLGHSACMEELAEIEEFLASRLPSQS